MSHSTRVRITRVIGGAMISGAAFVVVSIAAAQAHDAATSPLASPASWGENVHPASWGGSIHPASWGGSIHPASWGGSIHPASWGG